MHTLSPEERRKRIAQAIRDLKVQGTPEGLRLRKRLIRELEAIDAGQRDPDGCHEKALDWFNGIETPQQLLDEIQQDPLNAYAGHPKLADIRSAKSILRLRSQAGGHFDDFAALRRLGANADILIDDLLYTGCLKGTTPSVSSQPNVGVLLPVRLETRFYPPSGGGEWLLRVLVVPDEPSINRHDPLAREAELGSVEWLWQNAAGDLNTDAGRATWLQFAERHGPARAAWLARTFPPMPPGPDGVIRIERPAETREDSYFSTLEGFPKEIELWMARGGQPPVRVAQSDIKVEELLLDFPDPEDPDDVRWWSSWKRAQEIGLGIEITVGTTTPDNIDALFVIGLGEADPAELFGGHRDSGALGLIEPGTPTNTVDGAPAVNMARDPETWRQIALDPSTPGWGSREISTALTSKPDRLGALPGDNFNHVEPGHAMVIGLWPVLWGHALKDIWGLGDDVTVAGLWAGLHVVPEGPLPPIRINEQPYGLLPVTTFKAWQASLSDADFARIEEAMRPALIDMRAIWAEAAVSSGNVVDADTERLLTLLGRTSSANAYAYRYFLSLELLQLLYWGYDSGLGWLPLLNWWDEVSSELKRFQLNTQRRYISLGWPQDLRIPLVAPEDIPADTLFGVYLSGFFDPAQLVNASPALWLEVSRGDPSNMLPDSLLARLLLHARFVTSAEVYRAAHRIDDPALEAVGANQQDLTQLATWAIKMTDSDLNAGGPAVTLYEWVQQAIKVLLETPVGVLDRIMRATLDTAAYRIDPWITAFAWRRLQSSAAAGHQFQLGIYGWVDAPRPGTPGPTDGGLLHAPSEQQAITAVILRDKDLNDPEPGRWEMNLESSTIRMAERFAEEVRFGAHIQEVLGREVERIAGSKATVDSLRAQFPLRTEHAGRRTCNGEAVLKAAPASLPLSASQKQALEPLRRALDTYGDLLVAEAVYHVVAGRGEVAGAAMDAAAGLSAPPALEVISTRRTGRGINTNVVVALPDAAAPTIAFDASPGETADPAVAEFLATTVGEANTVTWCWPVLLADGTTDELFLSDIGLGPIDTVVLSEEALTGLILQAAPGGTVIDTHWQIIKSDGTGQLVALSELGLLPDEIVQLSEKDLARLALNTAPTGSTLGTIVPPEGVEAHRRARRIMSILGQQPAVPTDLVDTGALLDDSDVRSELIQRYQQVREVAELLNAELQDALVLGDHTRLNQGLVLAARWGITPAVQVGDQLEERVALAQTALADRLNRSPVVADVVELSAVDLARVIAELAAPEGQIVVLSRINLSGWPTAFAAAPTLDEEWLTVNAAVREPLARLETHQIDALLTGLWSPLSAWTNRPDDPWQINEMPSPNGFKPSTRLVTIYGPAGIIPANPIALTTVAVGLLDSWGETIPDVEQATTAAFGFNAPAARAPQAILMAVPPVEGESLTTPILVDILVETRELARARMAVPEELNAFSAALPLMMLPASGATSVQLDPKH